MQCAQCGTETGAGTSFKFYLGNHVKASDSRSRGTGAMISAYEVAGSEPVFLCYVCQIVARHRSFRRAVMICLAVIVLSPAVVGLILFPDVTSQVFSVPVAFVLSVPVLGIVAVVGVILGLGVLASFIIDAFGTFILIALTWRKPYAISGDDPDLDKTSEGEALAIAVCKAGLKEQGYDAFFTRKAYSKLGRTSRARRIITLVLVLVGLFALGLRMLAFIAVGGFLVEWIHF